MKPMLPTLTFDKPVRPGWLYEVKYDGFRAILDWDSSGIKLTSRNGKTLLPQFPEIKEFLLTYETAFKPFLPLRFDGELVSLENPYKASFSALQVRGRLKAVKKILEQAENAPCRLMVFDLLQLAGKSLYSLPFKKRKEKLLQLFQSLALETDADPANEQLLQPVTAYNNFNEIWEKVVLFDGEGIVAKNEQSLWEEGKRSIQWLKFKNWKYVNCFVTSFDKTNGYFFVSVYKDSQTHNIGQVLFGFKPEEKQALGQIIKQNMVQEDSQFIYVEPAICLEIKYLELYDNQLREPHFNRFRFDMQPHDCTFNTFIFGQKNVTEELEITHPEKPLWDKLDIQKGDYILYLREVSPYLLPFLKNRLLTVIRYPHGMFGEAFYQKNCPEYAPDFVETHKADEINYILCNNLKTLIWLGNQLAIEFHVPFQTINSNGPSEIVFDLDPPSKEDFHLAVKAALLIKEVLDQLNLIGFIKTSGNKGLQIYLPLAEGKFTYDDTRLFTSFIAEYLISKDPDSFTIERMKKKRGNRLYVDYVQHGEGKTIISPYSLRGNEHGGAATPLYWDEVDLALDPKTFTLQNALIRLKNKGDPFRNYFQTKDIQPFAPVLDVLKQSSVKKG
ncbi:DNA ligase D [Neobacillus kokaensis]|uniref:DNA ligase (ATP) n=1 Tax=Neobacillus kokaensis TaxID=2759023 RepID=A0ABQ3N2W7_9BACI|nr:DNA ligase D [Neobacillus kokaensis]GHH98338.1 bifunctional non-homologous end joining protein LigD [Neobacillus kokaensis]